MNKEPSWASGLILQDLCPGCGTASETKPLFHLKTFQWCPICKDDIKNIKPGDVKKEILHEFKSGDFVVCIDNNDFEKELSISGLYIVKDVFPLHIILCETGERKFLKSRFNKYDIPF